LSRKDFVFIWDEETLSWVADANTRDRRRESQSVPADIETAIQGVRRRRQGSKIFLFVPMSEQEQLYDLVPSFRPSKEITRRVAEKGIDLAKEAIQKTAVTQTTRPELPTSVRAGQKVGEVLKNSEEQEVGSSLPGLNRNESGSPANVTDQARRDTRFGPGTSMADMLGGGRQRIRTFIDLPDNSRVERKGGGIFSVNSQDSIFIYDRENNQLKPESIDAFYTGLYNLRPNEIAGFKRALGYSAEDANGILTDKFKDDLFDAAKAVSEYNYGYAQSGLKQPVDLARYLQTPQAYPEITNIVQQQKSGGTGGGGAAIDANRLAANVDTVRLLEVELGASLTKQQRDKIARDLATGRVNATTLRSTIVQTGKLSLDEGEAASLKAELKQNAAVNGVDLGEAWFDRITQNILQGKMAIETANTEILKQAKMKYAAPSLVAGLDAGFTIRDQVTPQINWLAQMRGVDPDSISLNDPILAKALINVNNEGMPVQMDSINWENWAKENDPAYATSSMAEEQYSSALRVMGQAFGKSI
jgi:hypothetical protein